MPVLYWLGVPLYSDQLTCPEGVADSRGDHQVGCGGIVSAVTINAIRDVVFNAAQSAALGPSKETPELVPDSASHPADVLLPNWTNGRRSLDVHVISPLQPLTLSEATRTQSPRARASNVSWLPISPNCRSMGASSEV